MSRTVRRRRTKRGERPVREHAFFVVPVNRGRGFSIAPPVEIKLSDSEAQRRKAELEAMNPGRRYVIVW